MALKKPSLRKACSRSNIVEPKISARLCAFRDTVFRGLPRTNLELALIAEIHDDSVSSSRNRSQDLFSSSRSFP